MQFRIIILAEMRKFLCFTEIILGVQNKRLLQQEDEGMK